MLLPKSCTHLIMICWSLYTTLDEAKVSDNSLVAAYKAERRKFKDVRRQQHKKGSSREKETLALLAKFQTKVSTAKQLSEYAEDEEEAKSVGEKSAAAEGGKEEGEAEESEEDDPTDLSWYVFGGKSQKQSIMIVL